MTSLKRLRVGVIGVGGMGRQHARILSKLPQAQLVAVTDADPDRTRRVAEEHGTRPYQDHRALVAEGDVDAVTIAVPTPLHFDVARDVIDGGIPLLVEKPIAASVAEGRALVAAAAARGVPLAVGHVERFNPAVRRLRALIGEGALGTVLSIDTRRVGILAPRQSQTNVVVDLAVHDIDVASYLVDRPPHLVAAMGGRAWGEAHDDWADLLVAYGDVACSIQVNWITPIKIRTLAITGTEGYAEVNYVAQTLDLYESTRWRELEDFEDFVRRYGRPAKREIPVQEREPLAVELEAFVASVLDGTPPEPSGEAALAALAVAEEAVALARGQARARD